MSRRSANVFDALHSSAAPGPGRLGVLATLVHSEGSAYQKAGARLYIDPAGAIFGLVSGGCLEQAIVDEALALRDRSPGEPRLLSYDTSDPTDLEFGFGLGCGGKLWVFFEAISAAEELSFKIRGTLPRASTEAIVVAADETRLLGRRLFFRPGELREEDLARDRDDLGPLLSRLHASLSGPAHSLPRSQLVELEGLSFALLQRPPEMQLSIFGAGPGAWPLAAMAQTLGWAVRVRDHRPAYLEDFPAELAVKEALPRAEIPSLSFYPADYEQAAAVVMTHNFEVDQLLVGRLSTEPWTYIGLLGSNKRCQKLLGELSLELPSLFAPAGLTLGGDDVRSIALALMAEIQAVSFGQENPSFRRKSYGKQRG